MKTKMFVKDNMWRSLPLYVLLGSLLNPGAVPLYLMILFVNVWNFEYSFSVVVCAVLLPLVVGAFIGYSMWGDNYKVAKQQRMELDEPFANYLNTILPTLGFVLDKQTEAVCLPQGPFSFYWRKHGVKAVVSGNRLRLETVHSHKIFTFSSPPDIVDEMSELRQIGGGIMQFLEDAYWDGLKNIEWSKTA